MEFSQALIGFCKVEPIRFERSGFFQSAINAPKTFFQSGSQKVPSPCWFLQAGFGQQLNSGFPQSRITQCGPPCLPFQHQSISGGTATELRWCRTAATQTNVRLVTFHSLLNVDHSDIPLPSMQRVADREELFLAVKFEFAQGFGSCLPPEAVELLSVNAEDVAEIALPSENGAHEVMEFGKLQVVGYREEANDHRVHLT